MSRNKCWTALAGVPLLCLTIGLAACQSSSSSDSGPSAPPPAYISIGSTSPSGCTTGGACTLTLTDSGGYLSPSVRVGVVAGPGCTGTANGAPTSVSFASGSGTATLSFTLNAAALPSTVAFTIYIDVDGSRTISPGDIVWGLDGTALSAVSYTCFGNVAGVAGLSNPLDFTGFGTMVANGVSTYAGRVLAY